MRSTALLFDFQKKAKNRAGEQANSGTGENAKLRSTAQLINLAKLR